MARRRTASVIPDDALQALCHTRLRLRALAIKGVFYYVVCLHDDEYRTTLLVSFHYFG